MERPSSRITNLESQVVPRPALAVILERSTAKKAGRTLAGTAGFSKDLVPLPTSGNEIVIGS
jgi:hypothetical protein